MKSRMSMKPVAILIGVGFCILISFQNCAGSKGAQDVPSYGKAENASVSTSDKDLKLINMPICPNHYETLTQGMEIYGSCVIANASRDFTLTVADRASKSDCASRCNENVAKFPGDKISCTFPGGGTNASIETAKNYCRVVIDENQVKLDSYALDKAACVSQCQIIGKDMDKTFGLKCEWQNRMLYLRVPDKTAHIDLGACVVTAKNSKGDVVATLNYASGTTEESCSNVVSKLKTKYLVDDVTYLFTKAEYVTFP